MEHNKESILKEHKKLVERLGYVPSSSEFQKATKISDRTLRKVFGTNSYSKLTEGNGYTPNKFLRPKSDLEQIFIQYGTLAKTINKLPSTTDWLHHKLKPSAEGIINSHKIKWIELGAKFLEYAKEKPEWLDVVSLFPLIDKTIPELKDEECYVYLMKDTRNNLHKIGISNKPDFREKTLQSEQPKIKLIALKKYINRKMALAMEQALHKIYEHKHKRGEWFNLDDEDIRELKATLDDYN